MKKFLCLLLTALMLVPTLAFAAELTPAPSYGVSVFSADAYDAVRLTANYPEYIMASDNTRYSTSIVTFAPKDGVSLYAFAHDSAYYVDLDTRVGFDYALVTRASYEVFLADAPEGMTVADGTDGYAAYVEPASHRAYGLIGMDAYEDTAKIYLRVYSNNGYMTKAALTELVTAECERIAASATVEDSGAYWSVGRYTAVTLADDSYPVSVTVDCADLTVTDAASDSADFIVMEDSEPITLETEITTSSYVAYQKENAPADCFDVTLTNGHAYTVYLNKYDDKVTTFQADTIIREADENDDRPIFFSMKLSSAAYQTEADVTAALETLDAKLTFTNLIDW